MYRHGVAQPLASGHAWGVATWWALAATSKAMRRACAQTGIDVRRDFPYRQRVRELIEARLRERYHDFDTPLHHVQQETFTIGSRLVGATMELLWSHHTRLALTGSAVLQAVLYGTLFSERDTDIDIIVAGARGSEALACDRICADDSPWCVHAHDGHAWKFFTNTQNIFHETDLGPWEHSQGAECAWWNDGSTPYADIGDTRPLIAGRRRSPARYHQELQKHTKIVNLLAVDLSALADGDDGTVGALGAFAREHFDLTLCANVLVLTAGEEPALYVAYPDDVLDRRVRVRDGAPVSERTLRRIDKYERRMAVNDDG